MDASRPALRRAFVVAAAAVPAAFAALFFVVPFAAILERGLRQDGRLSFPGDVLFTRETAQLVWFTTWQAAASTALTLALGLPLAWVVGRFAFRGHALVRALVLVPFVLPTVVVATAFLALLPERLEHGVWAILAAHAFFNIAVVARVVGGTWAGLDRGAWEVAATLGAGPVRRLREITLPLLAPALSAAAALTFLFCFTSFGVVLILGGPTRSTLETAIYDQAARAFDLRAAAALSLLQLCAVGLVLSVASRLESRIDGVRDLADELHARRRPTGHERLAVWAILTATATVLGLPLAVLVQRSFDLRAAAALSLLQLCAVGLVLGIASRLESRIDGVRDLADELHARRRPTGHERLALWAILTATATVLGLPLAVLVQRSFGAWHGLFDETPALLVTPWHAAVNSIAFASVATVIALTVGGLAAVALARIKPGAADALVLLPLGASAVMLGFGFLITFDTPPFDFRSSWWLVPVAQSLVAAPFVVRIVAPALRAIDPRLRDAAAVLGASPSRAWREVDLPLAARALGTAAGFAFAIALGEFGATVFLARADQPTLPVAIFRFLGRPGAENQSLAAALAVTLAGLAVIAALAAERAAGGRRGAL